jgi:hypothetical protein
MGIIFLTKNNSDAIYYLLRTLNNSFTDMKSHHTSNKETVKVNKYLKN